MRNGERINIRSRPPGQIGFGRGLGCGECARAHPDISRDAHLFRRRQKGAHDESSDENDCDECADEGEPFHGEFRIATEIIAESRALFGVPSMVVGIPLTARVVI